MDNLVLMRVAAALDASLAGAVVRDLREEAPGRIRLVLEAGERARSVVVSLRPEEPWVGRPVLRARDMRGRPSGPAGPFVAQARRVLAGAVVRRVHKPGIDRVLRVDFAEGHALVAELATHRTNLLLLEAGDRIAASARRPPSAAGRIATGAVYRMPELPPGVLVPTGRPPDEVDAFIEARLAAGEPALEVLRRHVFGLGTEAARQILAEAAASGSPLGHVLIARLAALERGELEPVIEGPEDLLERVREEGFDARRCRLLPWEPDVAGVASCVRREDAAATAGLYHEARDLARALGERHAGLRGVLSRERERLAVAEDKARSDQRSFEDPERHRRLGEALLAGMTSARRAGGLVLVPDPYAPDGAWIPVPVDPGRSLGDAASDCFRAHRRARRGLEQAARRVAETAERRRRLDDLDSRFASGSHAETELDRFEQALREAGIPVGLARTAGRRGRDRDLPAPARARLEGVRVFRTATGATLLAGKSARENHRLTFRIAAPEDFWFHAAGRRGAHVVLRNDERASKPSQRELVEAAAAAAWFSEGREDAWVDVHWTRRKYVRRARGAPAGTVLLKRFETLRVRPAAPAAVLTPLGR